MIRGFYCSVHIPRTHISHQSAVSVSRNGRHLPVLCALGHTFLFDPERRDCLAFK